MSWSGPSASRIVVDVLLVQLLRVVELVAVDQVAEPVDGAAHALGRRLARALAAGSRPGRSA